jgi:hypothetical protein
VKQVEYRSGAYEVLLCFPDGRCELKLTDHIDFFLRGADRLMLRGEPWLIVDEQEPGLAGARRRFVCEQLPVLSARPHRTPHAARDGTNSTSAESRIATAPRTRRSYG